MKTRAGYIVSVEFDARLKEAEARALLKLLDFGADALVKAVAGYMPEREAKEIEAGLRSLLKSTGEQIAPALHIVDQHRRDIYEAQRKREDYQRELSRRALAGEHALPEKLP